MAIAFISHASEDATTAGAVVRVLEARGVSCWIAPRDVRPGADYPTAIIEGIEGSAVLVLILTAEANASRFVGREVERAVSKGKPIFTVRAADVAPSKSLELLISSAHWIDAWPPPLDPHLEPLATAIHAVMSPSRAGGEGAVPIAQETSGRYAARGQVAPGKSRWIAWLGAGAAALLALFVFLNLGRSDPPVPASTAPSSPPESSSPSSGATAPATAPGSPATATADPCPVTLSTTIPLPHRCTCASQIGASGAVWGTDTYSADSMLCRAAVHAGAIPITGGPITVMAGGERLYYTGSSRNGVSTNDYGAGRDSITFAGVTPAPGPPRCPATLAIAPALPSPFTCQCTAEAVNNGRAWGSDVYTDDSALCRAALHAGVVQPSGGVVTVARADDRTSFTGSTRRGVATIDYDRFSRTMRFQ